MSYYLPLSPYYLEICWHDKNLRVQKTQVISLYNNILLPSYKINLRCKIDVFTFIKIRFHSMNNWWLTFFFFLCNIKCVFKFIVTHFHEFLAVFCFSTFNKIPTFYSSMVRNLTKINIINSGKKIFNNNNGIFSQQMSQIFSLQLFSFPFLSLTRSAVHHYMTCCVRRF